MTKIAICIPSRDTWKADFGLSLTMGCLALWQMSQVDGDLINIRLCHVKGSLLPENRNALVKQAIDSDCSHILWVDDDMFFPMDTFHKLFKRGVDIVGANCATKCIPPRPTAKNGRDYVFTTAESTGLEQVNRLGTGLLLMNIEVFKKMEYPYFACPSDPAWEGAPMGEDIYMIKKAQELGYKVYIDHDVSKHVGHIGDFHYTHDLMEEYHVKKES